MGAGEGGGLACAERLYIRKEGPSLVVGVVGLVQEGNVGSSGPQRERARGGIMGGWEVKVSHSGG